MNTTDYTHPPFPAVLGRVVVVDLETSGLIPGTHSILEIGAVPLDPHRDTAFQRDVRREWWHEWDPKAAEVHGLAKETAMCHRTRVTESVAVEDFLDWLDDVVVAGIQGRAVLAGMNPRFDRDFLHNVAVRSDMGARFDGLVSHRTIDLHTLAVAAYWRNIGNDPAGFPRGLDSVHTDRIYGLLGMAPEPRPHRAIEGATREAAAIRSLLLGGLTEMPRILPALEGAIAAAAVA